MGSTATAFVTGMMVCAAACIASEDGGTAAGGRPRAGAEWKLPAKQSDTIDELAGSADGRLICFAVVSIPPEPQPAAGGLQVKWWMLETSTGKLTDLGELLNKKVKRQGLRWLKAVPSPGGKYILLLARVARGQPKMAAYLLTLETGAVAQLARGMPLLAAWSKDRAYIGFAGMDGTIGPVRAVDPVTGKSTELKVCGLVAGADPTGGFLVCACDPDDPTKPLTREGFSKAWACIVSPDGKVLAKLVSSNEMSRPPEVSPGGKYLAFERQKWHGRWRSPELLGTRIVSADGKTQRDVKAGAPLAVTDKGELVSGVAGPLGAPAPVKFIDLAGKAVTLAPNAKAAMVCGDLLFYVPAGEPAKLKTVALKKR